MMRENVYFDDVNSKNLQLLRGAHPPSDTPLRRTSATISALRADTRHPQKYPRAATVWRHKSSYKQSWQLGLFSLGS